jgi:hypothetical protein
MEGVGHADFRIFAYEWEKFGDAKEGNENETRIK